MAINYLKMLYERNIDKMFVHVSVCNWKATLEIEVRGIMKSLYPSQ